MAAVSMMCSGPAVESTGYALWFHALMRQLGHTLLVGDAAKIRAMVVRKTKTDRRDALHLLDLLKHDRLPPARARQARVAVARKLLVRLFIMLRDRIDYEEFRRRGRAPHGPPRPVPA